MPEAVIVDCLRTPVGKAPKGALRETRPDDLAAAVLRELVASAAAGSAVVVYSADVDELLPLVDRMLVVFNGTLREVPLERAAVAAALVGAA